MRLGSRTAKNHDTAMSRQAVQSELFADFQAGQRVKTIDGIMGTVAAIEDGPFPGTEAYRVDLDHGLGGGLYTTGQLTPVAERKTSEHHTAQDDYPELGSILHDRPNIAPTASRHPFEHEARRPVDLGPDWTHVPGNKEFNEPEHYVHHDSKNEFTTRIHQSKGGMRPEWTGHTTGWCGNHETPPQVVQTRDYKPVRSVQEATNSFLNHSLEHASRHNREYHNHDQSCRYDPSADETHNLVNNHSRANYFRNAWSMPMLPGTSDYGEPHPHSPENAKWHEKKPIRDAIERDREQRTPQQTNYQRNNSSSPHPTYQPSLVSFPGVF